jgi:DNA polymerase I-like protein with 3'-5' exonuclease and polymerase domains
MALDPNALFLGTSEDKEYLPYLKDMFGGLGTFVCLDQISTLAHLDMYCDSKKVHCIVSTSIPILSALLNKLGNPKNNPSLEDYAGSLFRTPKGREIVFIYPLKQLFTVPYGKFIAQRFISKVTDPTGWPESTKFSWSILDPATIQGKYEQFNKAFAIAIDIETTKVNLAIRCVGYTAIFIDPSDSIRTDSIVIPCNDLYNLEWIRRFNTLPAPKIFQNGKYDTSYLLRYDAPCTNWLYDTAHGMHSWYSELPKDLAFLNAFFLREVVYWKDLAETSDLHEYYRYNAIDTWATANVWIQQMLQSPDWALRNYILEFPLVYPCLLAEMTGLARDPTRHISARAEVVAEEEKELEILRACLGRPGFNPGSPVQVKNLLAVLGCKDITSSGEQELSKASYRHPLNGYIFGKILKIRGLRKLRTTYLRTGDDITKTSKKGSKEFKGRILYALNPHGTDTARLASREHHFWCGLPIQNIPRGEPGEPSHTKTTIQADEGFYLGECDLEQAESRDLAYISGDTKLIENVTGDKDFHSLNASAFFGMSYESIYDQSTRKTKNKSLRDLSKRTNHGAGYNMGPVVMVDTIGLEKVWQAKTLLKLPFFDPVEITEYLITGFHITYPGIRGPVAIRSKNVQAFLKLPNTDYKLYAPGTYYSSVAQEIITTKRIVSRAFHHTEFNLKSGSTPEDYITRGDWTRYCFGSPDKNKQHLNSYVAHCPQSLNARTLNEAFMRVFYEIALKYPKSFRLHAQIHDSILFSYKPLCTWELEEIRLTNGIRNIEHPDTVRAIMELPVTVRDISGTYRTFTVPAALKLGLPEKPAIYWSETE